MCIGSSLEGSMDARRESGCPRELVRCERIEGRRMSAIVSEH